MVRKATLDEIAEESKEQAVLDYTGMHVEELIGATDQASRIMVREGKNTRPLSYNAANLLSIGMHKPKWLAGQFNDRVPEYWGQFWQEDDEETHPPTETTFDSYGSYETSTRIRPRGLLEFWAEVICHIEKDDVADDHHKRYYMQVYMSLVSGNHHKLGIGILPWGDGLERDAIVVRRVPKYIFPYNPDDHEEQEHETSSAADADW